MLLRLRHTRSAVKRQVGTTEFKRYNPANRIVQGLSLWIAHYARPQAFFVFRERLGRCSPAPTNYSRPGRPHDGPGSLVRPSPNGYGWADSMRSRLH